MGKERKEEKRLDAMAKDEVRSGVGYSRLKQFEH
jgi:hypothetical protein